MFQVFGALWHRRKWPALTIFLVSLAAAVSLVLALPNIYRASATVLVNSGDSLELSGSVNGAQDNRLDSITAQVMSRVRLQGLINRFDLYRELRNSASPEAVLDRMRRDIRLERKQTDQQQWGRDPVFAFTLSYQGWDPDTVVQVANALVTSYVSESNRVLDARITGTTNSLKTQMASIKAKLDSQQQRINAFKNNHMGALPEQQQANLATLTQMNLQLHQDNENELDAMRRRDEILKQMDASGDTSLAQLMQELSSLRTRYTDDYPDVQRLKAQIAAMKHNQAAKGTDPTPSPLQQQYTAIGAEIAAYKQKDRQLQAQIALYQKRVEDVPIYAQKLQVLKQGYAETQDIYSSLLKRYEKARLAEDAAGSSAGQYRILDAAVTPRNPVGPNRMRLLLIGLILSLGLAAGSVFLLEQLDTSFHTVAELRAFTTVPVLAGIPQIVTRGDTWRHRLWFGLSTLLVVLALVAISVGFRFIGHGNEHLVWMLTHG